MISENQKVIKRDGTEVLYDDTKVRRAVARAVKAVDGEVSEEAQEVIEKIVEEVNREMSKKETMQVETIQDIIEKKLMQSKRKDVAKAFILYRNERNKVRERNSRLIQDIVEKLNATNVQNQNANVDEASFGGRKGEATNELMKKMALDYLMSPMSRDNHLSNEIYIHDLDSYYIGMHNCFDSSTKFVTKNGVKHFGDCADGQIVEVIDKDGHWRKATVHKYGKQKMYDLTFTSSLTTKTVTCTRNHRWVLEDGSITDDIQIGDSLVTTQEVQDEYTENQSLWCFGFVLGDGTDFQMYSKDRSRITNSAMQVRLCGAKTEHLQKFLDCGWSIRQTHTNGDVTVITRGNGAFKQSFLDNKMWRIMSYDDVCNIFNGYIMADGHMNDSGSIAISTSDIRIKQMIEDISSLCGYYVWSQKEKYNDTNYKEGRTLYELYLLKKQRVKWTLTNITQHQGGDNGVKVAWCVEEPITHTFMLDGAMVTGNCIVIPFGKLLAEGFNTRQVDIRPAQSISTAFQLMAVIFQLQSLQEFGGCACSAVDWTMIPYIRKSFYKAFKKGCKYLLTSIDYASWLRSLDKERLDKDHTEISIEDDIYKTYPQVYQYAMDSITEEVQQSVEGMYHNLNFGRPNSNIRNIAI